MSACEDNSLLSATDDAINKRPDKKLYVPRALRATNVGTGNQTNVSHSVSSVPNSPLSDRKESVDQRNTTVKGDGDHERRSSSGSVKKIRNKPCDAKSNDRKSGKSGSGRLRNQPGHHREANSKGNSTNSADRAGAVPELTRLKYDRGATSVANKPGQSNESGQNSGRADEKMIPNNVTSKLRENTITANGYTRSTDTKTKPDASNVPSDGHIAETVDNGSNAGKSKSSREYGKKQGKRQHQKGNTGAVLYESPNQRSYSDVGVVGSEKSKRHPPNNRSNDAGSNAERKPPSNDVRKHSDTNSAAESNSGRRVRNYSTHSNNSYSSNTLPRSGNSSKSNANSNHSRSDPAKMKNQDNENSGGQRVPPVNPGKQTTGNGVGISKPLPSLLELDLASVASQYAGGDGQIHNMNSNSLRKSKSGMDNGPFGNSSARQEMQRYEAGHGLLLRNQQGRKPGRPLSMADSNANHGYGPGRANNVNSACFPSTSDQYNHDEDFSRERVGSLDFTRQFTSADRSQDVRLHGPLQPDRIGSADGFSHGGASDSGSMEYSGGLNARSNRVTESYNGNSFEPRYNPGVGPVSGSGGRRGVASGVGRGHSYRGNKIERLKQQRIERVERRNRPLPSHSPDSIPRSSSPNLPNCRLDDFVGESNHERLDIGTANAEHEAADEGIRGTLVVRGRAAKEEDVVNWKEAFAEYQRTKSPEDLFTKDGKFDWSEVMNSWDDQQKRKQAMRDFPSSSTQSDSRANSVRSPHSDSYQHHIRSNSELHSSYNGPQASQYIAVNSHREKVPLLPHSDRDPNSSRISGGHYPQEPPPERKKSPVRGSGGLLRVSAEAIRESERSSSDQQQHSRYVARGMGRAKLPNCTDNDGSNRMPGPGHHPQQRPPVEKMLNEVNVLEQYLAQFHGQIRSGDYQKIESMMQCRDRLQMMYKYLIVNELEISHKYQFGVSMWRSVFYRTIEILRSISPPTNHIQATLLQIIDQGTVCYESILSDLQHRWNINIADQLRPIDDDLCSALPPRMEIRTRIGKLAILSAQQCVLDLGDLARYKQQVMKTSNYGKARSWYLKAVQLTSKTGRSYNQLALLAVYTRRKLEAIYYYMRSLAAAHPFETAQQSLNPIFEEAHKKYNFYEEQVRAEQLRLARDANLRSGNNSLNQCPNSRGFDSHRSNQNRQNYSDSTPSLNVRREIWITPDGKKESDLMVEPDLKLDETDPAELLLRGSTAELCKRFITYFLELSRMLYCKIGIENLEVVCERTMLLLRTLLTRTQSPLNALQLVQVLTIILFCVKVNSSRAIDQNSLLVLHQQSLQVLLAFVGVLLERLCSLLMEDSVANALCDHSTDTPAQVHMLLPVLRSWAVWMEVSEPTYKEVPMFEAMRTKRLTVDAWEKFAAVCNLVMELEQKLLSDGDEGPDSKHVVLPEDLQNAGFGDVYNNIPTAFTFSNSANENAACDHIRLRLILDLGQFLDGNESPMLRYHPQDDRFVATSSISPCSSPRPQNRRRMRASESSEEGVPSLDTSKDDSFELVDDDRVAAQFRELRNRKREEFQKEKTRDVDESRVVELEICPSYIVADTNTWLDHFPLLKALISWQKFTILVPLIVVSELAGLSERSAQDFAGDCARAAFAWLHQQFDAGTPRLKAVTTQGSQLDSIRYGQDETGQIGTNDDKILKCCLYFCDDSDRSVIRDLKNQPLKLKRNIVLLTDDRNLRVKGLAAHVPVRTMPQFAKWANLH